MKQQRDDTVDAVESDANRRIGAVLKGSYELTGLLGQGGFGSVYAGVHHPIERRVAVKILDLPQRGAQQRFLREARVVASLTHPAAVTIYDYGNTDDGCPFRFMEYLDGWDLEVELRRGAMSPARLCKLLPDVLDALAVAHRQGLVHRDLKPSNLFLVHPGKDERLKVLDFGIAAVAQTDEHPSGLQGRLTAAGGIVGTPQYLSPEYLRDQTVSPALDVYQLGLIIAELLSGNPAVNEPSLISCAQKHLAGELSISAQTLATPVLGPIVQRAVSLEPEDRYADAGEMLAALSLATAQATPSDVAVSFSGAAPPTPQTPTPRPPTTLEPAPPRPVTVVESAASGAEPLPGNTGEGVGASGRVASTMPWKAALAVGAVLVVGGLGLAALIGAGWYASQPSDEPAPVVQGEDPEPPPTPAPAASIGGDWLLRTEVLGGKRGIGVQGDYTLSITSDTTSATLTKTGFTGRTFSRSEYQSGDASLHRVEPGAYELHPTIGSGKSTLHLTLVLLPQEDDLIGYWQYRGDSYASAGMWGVLAASRDKLPRNPAAADRPCLIQCLIERQKWRPAAAPPVPLCDRECAAAAQ